MPVRFQKIDDLTRPDHAYLGPSDTCFYLREYIPGAGYQGGETNQLIFNLKKPPSRKSKPHEWAHKVAAIAKCAKEMQDGLNREWLKAAVLVPMPPSKCKDDPEYDDRMLLVAQGIAEGAGAQVRELLCQRRSIEKSRQGDQRVDLQTLIDNCYVDEQRAHPAPVAIGLIDDVLTVGRHFRAACTVLSTRFPSVQLVGLFIARRIIVRDDTSDDD